MTGDPTFERSKKGRRALRRLIALGAVLVLLVLAGSSALFAFAGAAIDELQTRQERVLAGYTLERFTTKLIADVTTATVGDQAYLNLRPGGDLAWADAEIGSYYGNNLGHNHVLALDGRDAPFYAWIDDGRADPAALAEFQRDARPLIEEVRAAEQAGALPRGLDPRAPQLARTAGGVVVSGGVPYFVAVSNVVPATSAVAQAPGPKVLVLSAQKLSDAFKRFGAEMHGRDVAVVPTPRPGHNSVPLVDASGRTVGHVDWKSRLPGAAVLRRAAPIVGLGMLLVLAIGAVLARHMHQIIRQLEEEEAGRLAAIRDVAAARDRAEEANLAKSIFLANMSHEIRTPLNGILGMVQVMERSRLGDPHAERLEIIRDAGETLLSVLNGILDLSKIEAGRFQLDIQEFDLVATVDAACKPFVGMAAQKDLSCEIDIDPDARGVWRGDPMRLRQVLSNLTANAVKFTTEGEVRIEVEATGKGLAFRISDTGMGIPAERVAELFEKFVQADSSMSRRFGGTGLGLAICREFVDIMGGRLAVQTQEGVGSTFAFELPLPKVREASWPPAEADEPPTPALPLRVLAAEDSRPNQLVLKALLEPLGVDVCIAADGVEAVDAFKAGGFDAVLMDVQMPNMNGVEATRAIRAFEAQRGCERTPILALSANVMPHQVEEYLAAGMDGYVAKPIDLEALVEALMGSGAEDVRETVAV